MNDYDDNPEWTDADFANARPASEVHPSHVAALLVRPRGRPKLAVTRLVSLRLDGEVVDRLRAEGPGWQTRVNAALREVVGL